MFEQAPDLLNEDGSFIVQTIHPVIGCGDEKYIDGWRKGSWGGFNEKFSHPAHGILEQWKHGKHCLSIMGSRSAKY